MPVSVTMPRLGESVTEGTVTRWLKKEGERVEVDEPLLEVSTDKVDTEIPAPAAGIVSSIKVAEDETVEVGAELAVIDDADGATAAPATADAPAAADPAPAAAEPAAPADEPAAQVPDEVTEAAGTPAPPADDAPAPEVAAAAKAAVETADAPPAAEASEASEASEATPAAADEGAQRAYLTPLVRKLAAEHGVDLSSLQGTGVGGRIRKQDVLDAAGQGQGSPAAPTAQAPAAQAAPQTPTPQVPTQPTAAGPRPQITQPAAAPSAPLSRLRKVIAARMVESLQVSAQLTTVLEADVTSIAKLRQQAKGDFEAREGVKLSFLPFFTLAAIEALKAHPMVNASLDQDAGTVTYHEDVNLGIAVDTDRGLLVPVIHGAGDLNLSGVARKIADLAERTRTNRVSPDELGGGTFTVTNTGSRGALFDTPIINQPQVAILGTGAVVKRPVVVNDPDLGEVVAVRSMVYLALTYDHRIVDGADAARFLVTVKNRLEEGDFAAELGL
jgi:2-oxoglutarate dehydrogenase E2 component (dihydrolipoamide succinyltransferase)